jgi:hypothetical protein
MQVTKPHRRLSPFMLASVPEASKKQTQTPPVPLSRLAASAFVPALLVLQPVLFFWHVLINPTAHIPYDIEGFHLPLIDYVAQCLRNGVAPLWDPYSFGGVPIHADLQAQVFYPFTWLAVFMGNLSHGRYLFYWVESLVPLHMILGGLFTFLLLRKMGLSRPASLMGASVYQLGGFFASQAQHLCAICTGAWLPLAVLAAFELRNRFRPRWVAVLALAIALSILSGFAATTLIVGAAVLLVAAGWLITREASWRLLPGLAAGFLTGAAIAAVELAPLWMLTQASIASERARWHAFGGGNTIEILVSLVIPDYYHIFEVGSLYKLPYNFTLLYAYCGIASIILILLAPLVRRRRAILFLALTILSVFWMLGEHTPVYRTIFVHLPDMLRGALYAEYATMAFGFFAAITAAIVLDRFGTRLPAIIVWGIALFTSYDLIHTGADRPMNTSRGGPKIEDPGYRGGAEAVAVALRAAVGQTTPPSRVDYTDQAFFQGILGPGMLGVATTAGDNPFQLRRVMHVRRLYASGQPWDRDLAVTRFDSPLLNMLNVAVLAGAAPIPPDEVKKAGLEPMEPVRGIQIYRNPHALPRFFLVGRIRRSRDEAETLGMLSHPSFNPVEEAVVEGLPADREGLGTGNVRVDGYEANRIGLTVAADRPAFLVTSEVMYPGWVAKVNGASRPLLTTNGAFRGLALPAGNSRIVMEYHPWGLAISLCLTILACVGTAIVGLVSERRPGAAGAKVAEVSRTLWVGSRKAAANCVAACVARRGAIGSVSLIFFTIALFYWKLVLTSQFSLLTGTEAVNRSYSWLQFSVFNLRHGVQPLWDQYTLGGQKLDGHAGGFYPLHLALALAPLGPDGLLSPHLYSLWFVFVHLLGACFMFALAREFHFSRFPALVAGICFSLAGFAGATGSLNLLEGLIWLPLTLLFLLRSLRAKDLRSSAWNAAMSGLAFGMSVLAGSGDMVTIQILVIVSAGFAAAESRARAALAIGVTVATGFAAGALQWLPALGNGGNGAGLGAGGLSPDSLIAMLIPDAFHDGIGRPAAISPYMGVFPLLLAFVGTWKNWRNPWVRYFAWLALAAFLCSLGPLSLFHGVLSAVFPKLWIEDASLTVCLAGFAGALLAAFGTETLLSGTDGWSKLNRMFQAVLGVCGAGLLFAAAAGRELNPGVSMSVMVIFLSYGLFRYAVKSPRERWLKTLMVALILFDLNAFDRLTRNRQDLAAAEPNQLDHLLSFRGAARFLKAQPDPLRVQIAAEPPLNIADAFRIETIDDGESHPELWNARYRVLPASAQDPGAVYEDAFWKIYERPAYPRAWMVHQTVFEPSREGQLARLYSAGFDGWHTAAIDGHVRLQEAVPNAGDSVLYFTSDGNRVELEVDVSSRGLLVLSERFAPGWRAVVNGSRTPIYRVNGDLRGIVLDRGSDRIVLEYRPWTLTLSWVLTLCTFLVLFAARRLVPR